MNINIIRIFQITHTHTHTHTYTHTHTPSDAFAGLLSTAFVGVSRNKIAIESHMKCGLLYCCCLTELHLLEGEAHDVVWGMRIVGIDEPGKLLLQLPFSKVQL